MSQPGALNICIYQNATLSLVFVWTAGSCCCATGSVPQPVDLTGYTVEMQIKPYAGASAPLYYDATSNIVLGGIAGTIALTIPASTTGGFTWASGVYDLILTSAQGFATPLLAGTVTVTTSVSP